ncbi:hypothetical protein DFJ77DRAFT_472102 [Powellomyces hirtus]|nr:hypothetical protein DFJ77DRAFT_472102 [Powellomyces hirtus]
MLLCNSGSLLAICVLLLEASLLSAAPQVLRVLNPRQNVILHSTVTELYIISGSSNSGTMTRINYNYWTVTEITYPWMADFPFRMKPSACFSASKRLTCTDGVVLLHCDGDLSACSTRRAPSTPWDDFVLGMVSNTTLFYGFANHEIDSAANLGDPATRSLNRPVAIQPGSFDIVVPWNDSSLLVMPTPNSRNQTLSPSYLFHSQDGVDSWETFSTDSDPWYQLASGGYPSEAFATVAHWGKIYLFGGVKGENRTRTNDLLVYDPRARNREWKVLSAGWDHPLVGQPPPISFAGMSSVGELLVVHGTRNTGNGSNEVYFYNLTSESWVTNYLLIDTSRFERFANGPSGSAAGVTQNSTSAKTYGAIAGALAAVVMLVLISILLYWRRRRSRELPVAKPAASTTREGAWPLQVRSQRNSTSEPNSSSENLIRAVDVEDIELPPAYRTHRFRSSTISHSDPPQPTSSSAPSTVTVPSHGATAVRPNEDMFIARETYKDGRTPHALTCFMGDALWLIERKDNGWAWVHNATSNERGLVPLRILTRPKQ